jgi:hypothetical protein
MNNLLALSVASVAIGALSRTGRTVESEPRTFMFVEGHDTASETFTRSASSVTGDMAFSKDRIHYEAKIAGDGTIPRLDIRVSRAGAQTQKHILVLVNRDSTQLIEQVGSKTDSVRVATQQGMLPFINFSVGLSEVLIERGRQQKARAATVPVIVALDLDNLGESSPAPLRSRAVAAPLAMTFVSPDSVRLGTTEAKDRVRIAVGSDGNIRGVVSGADAKDHFKAMPKSKAAKPQI